MHIQISNISIDKIKHMCIHKSVCVSISNLWLCQWKGIQLPNENFFLYQLFFNFNIFHLFSSYFWFFPQFLWSSHLSLASLVWRMMHVYLSIPFGTIALRLETFNWLTLSMLYTLCIWSVFAACLRMAKQLPLD